MARRARIVKTDRKGYGRPHREHRSKKNRKIRNVVDHTNAKQRKRRLEELKLQDLDEEQWTVHNRNNKG